MNSKFRRRYRKWKKEIVKIQSVDPRKVDIVEEIKKKDNNLYYMERSLLHGNLELTNIKYISVREFERLKELGIPLIRVVEEENN